jgi:hypothetical protein
MKSFFGAPSGRAKLIKNLYAPHGMGAPSLATGGAEIGSERR